MGKVIYNEDDFQKAAAIYKDDLLAVPYLALKDSTKFMTLVTGVRYEQIVGAKSTNAKFKPAGKHKKDSVDLKLDLRLLKTYPTELTAEFDPNQAIQTLIGHLASQASGDELKNTPSAKQVLGLISKQASEPFTYVIWSGVRNPEGEEPEDVCDGLDTITANEVEDGAISVEKGNLIELEEEITVDNILDIVDRILDSIDIKLRRKDTFLYCDQRFADLYNRAYKKASAAQVYNTEYEQNYLEGSNRKITIAPMEGKVDTGFYQITTKLNTLVGCDKESDLENVKVKEYEPRLLTYMQDAFLGTQFRCIDKSEFCAIKLFKKDGYKPAGNNPANDNPAND
ncbi:MAG: hypothetical protein K2J70_06755 [Muribaculaceae bacterium]|nr:hypothetical protein [Muribaculaceae bacterium]